MILKKRKDYQGISDIVSGKIINKMQTAENNDYIVSFFYQT